MNSIKYEINCQTRADKDTKSWLELTSKFDHNSPDYKVYQALMDKEQHIVAKVGPNKLEEEYEISKQLAALKLPTLLHAYCIFKCLDTISEMNAATRYMCKEKGDTIYVMLTPYINGGKIDDWKWTRTNFDVLKNTIKHVFLTALYAKKVVGFSHKDLHLGNILMKRSQRKEISYGDFGTLEVMGVFPVIMDYDKANMDTNSFLYTYRDLKRFIALLSVEIDISFNISNINRLLDKYITENSHINPSIADTLCKAIDTLDIQYILFERPATPNFLKPTKV